MSRRIMARPLDDPPHTRLRGPGILALLAVLAVLVLLAVSGMFAGGAPSPKTSPSFAVAGLPSELGPTDLPSDPGESLPPESTQTGTSPATSRAGDGPGATPFGSPVPAGTPPTTSIAGAAPTSPDEFDLQGQVIPMGFPLRRETRYHYRDNFLDLRDGAPAPYNHARIREDGSSVRLHDGVDLYADEGVPVVAVFAGTVIDPRTRWEPWDPERYGKTVVILSDEPGTGSYVALYAHLDRVWVEPGMHVSRGQVLGALGRTGNADLQSVHAHLHLELRAPFPLDWSSLGEERSIDAFNPYPSLRAADPKRT